MAETRWKERRERGRGEVREARLARCLQDRCKNTGEGCWGRGRMLREVRHTEGGEGC